MDTPVLLLVLIAAILHALWNVMVKSNDDKLLSLAFIAIYSALLVSPMVFQYPLPARESWLFLGFSVFLHLGYNFYLAKAYRESDLSLVYPVARGSAPLIVTVGAFFLAGEKPAFLSLLGIMLTASGIMLLALNGQHQRKHAQKTGNGLNTNENNNGIYYALTTGLFIAAYTLSDGMGARLSGHTVSYIVWLFLLQGSCYLLLLYWIADVHRLKAFFKEHSVTMFKGAAFSTLAYGLVIYAVTQTNFGEVSALRETSVVFATIFGVLFLKERVTKWRWLAVMLVCCGVIMMLTN